MTATSGETSCPVGHEIALLQLLERRSSDSTGVRIPRRRPMAREMLEHRHDARIEETLCVGAGVLDDHLRVGRIRTVADDRVVGLAAHVDVGSEVDGDTEFAQFPSTLEGHLIGLLDRHGLGGDARRRIGAQQCPDTRHPSALLVDGDHQRQRALRRDTLNLPFGEHCGVGPASDEDAADLFGLHGRTCVVRSGDSHIEQLRKLLPARERGEQIVAARRWRCRKCLRGRGGGPRLGCRGVIRSAGGRDIGGVVRAASRGCECSGENDGERVAGPHRSDGSGPPRRTLPQPVVAR